MDVYFSTIVRGSKIEKGGELVWLNWATKEIKKSVPIFPENPTVVDPNPRGNSRGGRGVTLLPDGNVAAACYHSIYIFSPDLNQRQQITNNLLGAIHDIALTTRKTLLVASTAIDAVLELDYKTGKILSQFWPRELPGIQQELGVEPLGIDKQIDNRIRYMEERYTKHPEHLHLNSATEWNGDFYALLHTYGAVVNLSRDKIVFRDVKLRGAHNLLIGDNGIALINNTYKRSVQFYTLKESRLVREIVLTDFPEVKRLVSLTQKALYIIRGVGNRLKIRQVSNPLPFFVRGMSQIGEDRILVGLSPSTILEIEISSGKLIDHFTYSYNLSSCIYGICARI